MNASVFVDTNVFVYVRDKRDGLKHSKAEALIAELWREQRGRTSMQVLSELYVTMTRKLDPGFAPDEAWEDVAALLAWDPQPIDRETLRRAREVERRHTLSWWDSLIVAAAQLQHCTLLLSEDLQDGFVCGTVTVRNPFVDRVADSAEVYAAPPKPMSRHRRRGRPRTAKAAAPA